MMKKMVLVPQELASHMQTNAQTSQGYHSQLDNEIKHILERSDISEQDKWKMYQQILHRYLHYSKQLQQPVSLPIFTEQSSSSVQQEVEPVYQQQPQEEQSITTDIVQSVPKGLRSKTQLLVNRLVQSGLVTWNKDGVVTMQGKEIPQSNIIDLVHEVVRNRKTPRHPTGIGQFTNILQRLNIPREYLGRPVQSVTITKWDENL